MENSMRFGLMTVFAVSGSMVLLAHQVHKRLFSNFMKKFEFELVGGALYPHDQKKLGGCKKHQTKKKVRFAEEVLEIPMVNYKSDGVKVTRAQHDGKFLVMEDIEKWRSGKKLEDTMPPNRAVLYRGIMKYKGRLDF